MTRMAARRLGRTGHHSAVAVLGGAAFWDATADQAAAAFALAIERGVNHLDIAPQYGVAEDVVGPLVPSVRDRLFVAGKTLRKNADGVRAQLETTLAKLGCDRLDLYQVHGVTDLDDLDTRDGAFTAILAARDEGLVGAVGVTGHDLGTAAAQLQAVRRYDLDTVMFPVYARVWADARYRADAEALLAECARRDVGVMAIKALARRPWGERTPTRGTWYEPWTQRSAVEQAVAFTLSTPGVHALCTPGDLDLLPTVLDAVEGFETPADGWREEWLAAAAGWPEIFPIAEHARR